MADDWETQAIFAVRFLLLIAVLAVGVAFAVAGIAKAAVPGQDVGHLAITVAWPGGTVLALLLRWWLRRRRTA